MRAICAALLVAMMFVLGSCDLGPERVEPIDIPQASDIGYIRVWKSDLEHRIADPEIISRIVAIIGTEDIVWEKAATTLPGSDAKISFRLRTDEGSFVLFIGSNWVGDPPDAVATINDADMQVLLELLGLDKS
jgi:hypothetical protein